MSIFNKSPEERTPEDMQFFDNVVESLHRGDKVYGDVPDTRAHIEWVIGYLLYTILNNKEEQVLSFIELGRDEQGLYISLFNLEELFLDSVTE